MAKHFIRTVNFRGIFGDRWLLKLEKKAFGWHYYGSDVADHSYIDWLEFRRQNPYSNNVLFVITEFLSKIWSFLRRLALVICTPTVILSLVVTLLDKVVFGGSIGISDPAFKFFKLNIIGYLVGLVLPTLILSLAGFWLRKIFQIDEKASASLRNDGYDDDLSDCSIDGE